MPLELVTIPCLSDNYVFLLHSPETGETAVVDAPETGPILAELAKRQWQLTEIWLTHHHWDHVDGALELRDSTGASITGAAADAHRLPPLNRKVSEGQTFSFAGNDVNVYDVSGHSVGHVAFYVPAANAAFTGDSLMALGCGRIFEGTADQMWASLGKLAKLPADTIICSGHEYSESNAKFALTVEPDNAALQARAQNIFEKRAKGMATVPTLLGVELDTNPFLRAGVNAVKSSVGMEDAPDAQVFAEIRRRKDQF